MELAAHDGTPLPDLKHVYCRRCGVTGAMVLEMRLEAKEPGTYSVAGVQEKVVATEVPWLRCTACGAEGKGKPVPLEE